MVSVSLRRYLLSTAAMVLIIPSAANAYQTYSVGFGPNATSDLADVSQPDVNIVQLPQFSGSPSTLTGIVVTLTAGGSAVFTATNTGKSGTYSFTDGSITGWIATNSTIGSKFSVKDSFSISGVSGTVAHATTFFSDTLPIASTSSSGNIIAADWGLYEGTSTTGVELQFTDSVTPGGTTSGKLSFGGSVSMSGVVTIEYLTSNPIPEPGSLAILGAGLVGAGVLRRRSKRAEA